MVSPRQPTVKSLRYAYALLCGLGVVGLISPAVGQSAANFGSATLRNGSVARPLQGHTQGTTPLSTIARQDAQGNHCIGYGESEPDHILILPQALSRITLSVNSGGQDTTLLVRGGGQVFCADDSNNADARLQAQNWGPGEYQVWVGSFDPGVRYDYQLGVQGSP
ncbi:MAG: hypothetical protein AAF289_02035 [Cyanobacteria bacterium P01_A01_bin.135]